MKHLTLIAGMLLANAALAAPVLTANPYPDGPGAPKEFVVSVSGMPNPVVVPAVKSANNLWLLRYDVGNLGGERTITVQARNASGISASSAPFYLDRRQPTQDTRRFYAVKPLLYKLQDGKWVYVP